MKLHAALLSKAPITHLAFSKLVHVTAAAYWSAVQHTLLVHIHTLNNTATHTRLCLLLSTTAAWERHVILTKLCSMHRLRYRKTSFSSGVNTQCATFGLYTLTSPELRSSTTDHINPVPEKRAQGVGLYQIAQQLSLVYCNFVFLLYICNIIPDYSIIHKRLSYSFCRQMALRRSYTLCAGFLY